MASHSFELFAEYYQFYLQDEAASGDLAEAWSPEATDRYLAVAPGVIGVRTARNMDVPVHLEFLESEPTIDLQSWDQVVECSLKMASGSLVLAGCTDQFPDARRFAIAPGVYRVRVSYANLSSLSSDGLDGDDHYRVQLWPGTEDGVSILRRRDG